MVPFVVWIAQSLLILGIFHMAIPTIVHAKTRNSWLKLPVMIGLAVAAGAFMAWLGYVPYLLFFLWLLLTHYTLKAMRERKFEADSGMNINKPVFYISSYVYVVLACVLAWLFQIQMASTATGPGTPLWKELLGVV